MLIVAGSIRVDPDHRSAMLEAVVPMVAATRAEPGCRAYAFSPDPDDELESSAEISLRPASFAEFVGQKRVTENLKIAIEAAKERGRNF